MDHPAPKLGTSSHGEPMHYSAGALIVRDGRYLLVNRRHVPLGWAGLAGHIDEGEEPCEAAMREVHEESQLTVIGEPELLFEEEISDNTCGDGISTHYWYLYQAHVGEGEPHYDPEESFGIGWYSKEDIAKLELEPVWHYWFKKLGIVA